MLRTLLSLALGALLALPVPEAMAIGFGRVGNATLLGQALDFTVTVRLEGDESLSAECISVEVFAGESRLPPSTVRVAIEPGPVPAERTLRVTSTTPIEEPVVGVNFQLACPNRLARKFVAFIDPPVIELARSAPAALAPAAGPAAPRSDAPPMSTAALAARAPSAAKTAKGAQSAKAVAKTAQRSRRPASVAKASPPRTVALAGEAAAPSARKSAASAKAAPAPAAAPGARLELQAADHAATRERLNLRPTSTLTPAAAAAEGGVAPLPAPASAPAAIDEDAAQRARERERLLAVEGSLAKLRAESQATQASLAQLQLRLREAEQQRYANPLVFGLAALAAALAAVVGVLLWRRAGERRAAPEWWAPPAPVAVAASGASEEVPADDWAAAGREPRPGPRRPPMDEPAIVETTASPMMLAEVHALTQAPVAESARGFEPAHEMSVEELMDLEQQAEFFVVLGQDEAAIDLLMGHLRSSGGASPLPYLKLLEIYRRRDEREAFDRMRERFNRRFNAYAPDWQADPQQGRALLDYPPVVERLQSLWARPTQTMQALEAALFRRDAGSSTFDLPAYRELLLLYAVARDLSEREAPPAGVDLLLPLGGEAADAQPVTRLHPSPAAGPGIEHATLVDLDITGLDAGPSENDDRPSRFHTDFSPTSGYMGLPGEARPKSA